MTYRSPVTVRKGRKKDQACRPLVAAEPVAGSSDGRRQFVTVGLFAGIGGIELGLDRAGHRTALFCENDATATAVLQARFPGIPVHPDIRELAGLPPGVSLLAGGFPCQDLSQAGMTAGITGPRSGLVGHVFRLLETHPVPWVLLENVPFMLQLGKGKALEVIVREFERLGYRWAYRVVDSRAFGLPQRRERVYFLASLKGDPRDVILADDTAEKDPFGSRWRRPRLLLDRRCSWARVGGECGPDSEGRFDDRHPIGAGNLDAERHHREARPSRRRTDAGFRAGLDQAGRGRASQRIPMEARRQRRHSGCRDLDR